MMSCNRKSVGAMGFFVLWLCAGCAEPHRQGGSESAENTTGALKSLTMEEGTGTLFIIGGGSRPLSLMQGVVDRMASKDDLVVVLPMASSQPDTSAYYGIKPFRELGCTDVHALNLQPGHFGEAELDSVRNARAMYLCGGDQARFMKAIGGTEGPVAEAIREAYRRGAVISGSSAGAAMMSRAMITGDQKMEPDYERTYARLYADNGVYLEGLGLIENAVIDQHFVERSRYNRALSALHDYPGLPVFGIGESTALVVEPHRISVEGEGHVVVFHPNAGEADSSGQLSFRDLRVDILTAGDTLGD